MVEAVSEDLLAAGESDSGRGWGGLPARKAAISLEEATSLVLRSSSSLELRTGLRGDTHQDTNMGDSTETQGQRVSHTKILAPSKAATTTRPSGTAGSRSRSRRDTHPVSNLALSTGEQGRRVSPTREAVPTIVGMEGVPGSAKHPPRSLVPTPSSGYDARPKPQVIQHMSKNSAPSNVSNIPRSQGGSPSTSQPQPRKSHIPSQAHTHRRSTQKPRKYISTKSSGSLSQSKGGSAPDSDDGSLGGRSSSATIRMHSTESPENVTQSHDASME
jgi:hypothetical protein